MMYYIQSVDPYEQKMNIISVHFYNTFDLGEMTIIYFLEYLLCVDYINIKNIKRNFVIIFVLNTTLTPTVTKYLYKYNSYFYILRLIRKTTTNKYISTNKKMTLPSNYR